MPNLWISCGKILAKQSAIVMFSNITEEYYFLCITMNSSSIIDFSSHISFSSEISCKKLLFTDKPNSMQWKYLIAYYIRALSNPIAFPLFQDRVPFYYSTHLLVSSS